jgi:hypothetical protein
MGAVKKFEFEFAVNLTAPDERKKNPRSGRT